MDNTRQHRTSRCSEAPRLLYVVYNVPHVPATGAFTRAYHLVQAAARVGRLTLLGVVEPELPAQPEHIAALAPISERVETVAAPPLAPTRLPRPLATARRHANDWLGREPSILWRFDTRPLRDRVAVLLATGQYDLVIVEHTEMAAALRPVVQAWGGASLADLHNLLSVHQRRVAALEQLTGAGDRNVAVRDNSHPLPPGERRAVRRLEAVEREIARGYSRVTTCSRFDAAQLAARTIDARIGVIPNGVDCAYFRPVATQPSDADTLIFTGALWYRPNVDALRFFLATVWPRVRARRPEARLRIVGARPNDEVRAMAGYPAVSVFGSVPDVRPYLAESAAAIVPLRLGSGTRLKILEALATRRPVISTTLGAEGLELEHGRDLLLADRADDFADAVVRLLEHPEEARALAAAGQATVAQHYDWQVVGEAFQEQLADLLRSRCPAHRQSVSPVRLRHAAHEPSLETPCKTSVETSRETGRQMPVVP